MSTRHRNGILFGLAVAVTLLCGWLAYQPALSGPFLLDDAANLGELRNIDDSSSALRFVLSGTAGPAGRPIALASFLPQADSWDNGPSSFLKINIAIHLFNACLLGAFLLQLGLTRGVSKGDVYFAALISAALWLFMPLLATSTLMVVQRMTTLSATFVFIGLNGYLYARQSIGRSDNLALGGMTVALVVATALAVLTKESGALLPVLVLVLEGTLLKPPGTVSVARWRTWLVLFLALPTAIIVGYLLSRLPYSESLVLRRDFSGWERLMTEARILWQYMANAFLPRPGEYGPFHDAYPVTRSFFDPVTLAAFAGWLVAAALALVWRRKYVFFSFAVLWFLAGHLLESTTIPLELYFEHRNYVPIVGPVYALCHSALQAPRAYHRITRVAFPLYILVLAFFLFSLTSMWGDPAMAARYWHDRYPDSSRAASMLATRRLATDGPSAALATLADFVSKHPGDGFLGIPMLSLSCIIAPENDHRREVDSVKSLLPDVGFSYTAGTMLSDLVTTTEQNKCKGIGSEQVMDLARTLASNPRYELDTGYQQLHQQLMARIARDSGDVEGTLDHLKTAIRLQPASRLNMMVVTTLVSAGRFQEARDFIAEARAHLPRHPLKRRLWQLDLVELSTFTIESEKRAPTGSDTSDAGSVTDGHG